MSLILVVGNKNYSSWSMRPWVALRAAGIPFEEVVIPMYVPGSKEQILTHSPAGKVPVLKHDDVTVWDSLAIIEYAAEVFPEAGLWPANRAARALARSISAEMHSGFVALRKHCTMNVRRVVENHDLPENARADIARIEQIWSNARERHGDGGSFLFGSFTAADAMYAPVVTRLRTYTVPVSPSTQTYMNAVLGHEAVREWCEAGVAEPWVIPEFEV